MARLQALPIVSAVLALCVSSSSASAASEDGVRDTEEAVALLEPTVHKFDRILPKEAW